jgi:autotransporter-associated beta strand protein
MGTGPIALDGDPAAPHTLRLSGDSDPSLENTLSSKLTGNLALIKSGASTWVLTGNNDFTGGTVIESGRLQIGEGGSLSGHVDNAGTLGFRNSADSVFGGSISGTGLLVKEGSGKLTLSGQSDFAGETEIAAGALELTGSLAGDIHVANGATFDVSHLVQAYGVGAGHSLSVDGTVEGSVEVSGTVSGQGSINGGLTILAGGTLASGLNGPGALGITGTLTLSGGATLSLQLTNLTDGLLNASAVHLTGEDGGVMLNLSLLGSAQLAEIGQVIFLVNNTGSDGILGTFANATGSYLFGDQTETILADTINGQQYAISYDADLSTGAFHGGNDIAVMAIPEPSTGAVLLAGVAVLGGWRRLRRRAAR